MNQLFTITLIMAIIVLIFAGVVLLQLIIANFRKDRRDNATMADHLGIKRF
jgi:uncharacterized membrane protein